MTIWIICLLPAFFLPVSDSQESAVHRVMAEVNNPAAMHFYHGLSLVNKIICVHGEAEVFNWDRMSTSGNPRSFLRGSLRNRAVYFMRGTKSLLLVIETVEESDAGVYRCQFFLSPQRPDAYYDVILQIGARGEAGSTPESNNNNAGQGTQPPASNSAGERLGYVVLGAVIAVLVIFIIWLKLDYRKYKKGNKDDMERQDNNVNPAERRTVKNYIVTKFASVKQTAVEGKDNLKSCTCCQKCKRGSNRKKNVDAPQLSKIEIHKLSSQEMRLLMSATDPSKSSLKSPQTTDREGSLSDLNISSHISQSPMPTAGDKKKHSDTEGYYSEPDDVEVKKSPSLSKKESIIYANISHDENVYEPPPAEKTKVESGENSKSQEKSTSNDKVLVKPKVKPKPRRLQSKENLASTDTGTHTQA